MSYVPEHPLGLKPEGLQALKRIISQPMPGKTGKTGPIKDAKRRISINKTVKDVANTPVRLSVPQPERKTVKGDKEAEPKLVDLAKKRFQQAADAESEMRKFALDDLKFRAGEQWPDGIKRQREIDGRPCLTINQMPQFIRQVTNDQRQNRPSIQVNPVNDEADPETAEIIQGIIRHIEYDSSADAAYDTAFQASVTSSFGYFRINTAYSDPMSFEQDIKILRIRNPFTVYFDPNCKEPDYSDANWAFVTETISKDDYKDQWPDSKMATTMDDWESIGDTGWADKDSCRIVEYFYRESVKKTVVLLSDGATMLKEYIPEGGLPKGVTVVNERQTQIFAVKWVKMNGVEVLEETDWPGKWIPVVPVLGDELDIDGKRVIEGIVRNAKEPQRQYNFMSSASTEAIALAPKAPYIVAEGQLEGHEQEWQTANIKNNAFLSYKAVSINGQPMPPPQRNTVEPAIQATTEAMMQAAQDLKAVTGIYQAALGAQGNETSGKGILARQSQSQGSNYHYIDNLTRALKHAGRILLDLIPKVYDTQRVLRIIGEDGTQSTVEVNTPQEQAASVEKVYDLSVGKYDVTISTGPSYQTKRQEAVQSQIQLVSAYPPLMGVAGDIMVGNMDWPGAKEISERMKKSLPPQLQDDPTKDPNLPPEVQQHVAQLTAELQKTQQGLMAATKDVHDQISAKQVELESKERIEFAKLTFEQQKLQLEYAKIQAGMVNADIAAKASSAETAFEHEMDMISQQMGQAHEYAMAQDDQEHQQDMQAQQPQGAEGANQ